MKKDFSKAIKRNFKELIFVFLAFTLMALVSYLLIGNILRQRLLDRTEEIISTSEANIRAGLSEAETTLLNSYHIVKDMIEKNASDEEILEYLENTTQWMRQRTQGLVGFYGIYGFMNGELLDGIGLNPGPDYIAQTRPWYQLAIRTGDNVAYTAPYVDWRTGDIIVSAVKNIDIDNNMVGILAIDININWLVNSVSSMTPTIGSYGMLISQNMSVMAHPESSEIGKQLQQLGGNYAEITRSLRNNSRVFDHRIKDSNGKSVIVFFTRISNGWYVGLVIPYYQFNRDIYIAAFILVILGFALSLLLCFMLLRFSVAKQRSDEENKSKSSFLASMSHEIRTPMNAITGMAELLLRTDLPGEARSYAQDIKQAGNNLISIINDILDLSKIEAGRLEISSGKYLLSSLLNDTVNIIRTRLIDRPIRFYTNIDANIPNSLIGDEVRLRQILLNLLSNAVKYSEKGHIGLMITGQIEQDNQIKLIIVVTDTGKGIKFEDQLNLFGDFVRVDKGKNRGIEGTGLGLSITKRLCIAMGGNISVESQYGAGSVFIASVMQKVDQNDPFAQVVNPQDKKVLVYEGRSVYVKSVGWSLKNMKVPHVIVKSQEEFSDALQKENWYFVFSSYGLYNKIKPIMDSIPDDKRPPLALMVEWGTEAYIPNVRFISLPVQSLSIANVLNGTGDNNGYFNSMEDYKTIRFTMPEAKILIVDDLLSNLKVAEGLLSVYNAKITTCLSGAEALVLVKRESYDLIFMDHMMPEMDGIETTIAIRAWEKETTGETNLPIVALTANAVVGMREMFLEKGFSDFLAKPIDVSKLDEILDKWIPKDKKAVNLSDPGYIALQENLSQEQIFIPGVDTVKGIASTGGKIHLYMQVLDIFCNDVKERLSILNDFADNIDGHSNTQLFITNVHALKSALGTMGAMQISQMAADIEKAAADGNFTFVKENLYVFMLHLVKLVDNVRNVLESKNTGGSSGDYTLSQQEISLFSSLTAALKEQNAVGIERIMDEFLKNTPEPAVSRALQHISGEVLKTEYENAIQIIDKLVNKST